MGMRCSSLPKLLLAYTNIKDIVCCRVHANYELTSQAIVNDALSCFSCSYLVLYCSIDRTVSSILEKRNRKKTKKNCITIFPLRISLFLSTFIFIFLKRLLRLVHHSTLVTRKRKREPSSHYYRLSIAISYTHIARATEEGEHHDRISGWFCCRCVYIPVDVTVEKARKYTSTYSRFKEGRTTSLYSRIFLPFRF